MDQLLKAIRSQPESTVLSIISNEDACHTYIKLLPPLSQQIFFRLLLLPDGFPVESILKWFPDENDFKAANELREAYLVETVKQQNGQFFLRIKREVLDVILDGSTSKPQAPKEKLFNPYTMEEKPKIITTFMLNPNDYPEIEEEVLNDFARGQLEKILTYMLSLPETSGGSDDIRSLLSNAGLIDSGLELLPDGYRFLLMSPKEQIWRIVESYLYKNNKDIVESMQFILRIGSMQLTHGYPIAEFSDSLQALLVPFEVIGLIYIKDDFFYPTKSILNFFGKSDIFKSEGWLFIDTNFKITAYPKNELQAKLLTMFTTVTYMFPGFISAFISPQSYMKALERGTKLDDIVNFLNANLSKTKGSGEIPYNVKKQLQVWIMQRDRIKVEPKCQIQSFSSEEEAKESAKYAYDRGILVYGPEYLEENNYYIVVTKNETER